MIWYLSFISCLFVYPIPLPTIFCLNLSELQFCCSVARQRLHPSLCLNKQMSQSDLGTVECSSWHGEPDPWAFQQHSSCTAAIPGTGVHHIAPSFYLSSYALFASLSSFSIDTLVLSSPSFHSYLLLPFSASFQQYWCGVHVESSSHKQHIQHINPDIIEFLLCLFSRQPDRVERGVEAGGGGGSVLDGTCTGLTICMSCTRIRKTLEKRWSSRATGFLTVSPEKSRKRMRHCYSCPTVNQCFSYTPTMWLTGFG